MNRISVFIHVIFLLLISSVSHGYTETDSEGPYISKHAEQLLIAHKFDELEKIADKYRKEDTKLKGGNSAFYHFYPGIGSSQSKDSFVSSLPSEEHLKILEEWLKLKPKSTTARIALSIFWNERAWQARGSGYANSVNETQWGIFRECLQNARKYLRDADPKTDPMVDYVLMEIEMGASKPRARLDALFEEATRLHPTYYHYYPQREHVLQEKWYGAPGELKIFADSLVQFHDHDIGVIAYSYVTVAMLSECECNANDLFNSMGLAWEPLKQGFDIRLKKYGLRNRDWNTLTLFAALSGHPVDAKVALNHITEWDPPIWKSRENYDRAIAWINASQSGADKPVQPTITH